MIKNKNHKFQAGFAFIEILLMLAAVLFIYYAMTKFYSKEPAMKKEMAGQDMDTTDYKTILDGSKKILQKVQSQHEDIEK